MHDLDFRALFENAPGAYLVIAPDDGFRILAATPEYLEKTRSTSDAIIGRPLAEIHPHLSGDPRASREAIDRERLITQLQEQAVELEMQAEELQSTAAMLEERTEEAELARADAAAAEQRLRDVFEQAPVAVAVMTGPDLVYTIASPRYVEMLGGRRLIGLPLREALPELVGQRVIETVKRVFDTGVPFSQRERKIRLDKWGRGTLEDYYFNVGYQPLRDAVGRVYAVASTAYEVTVEVMARHALEDAQADARVAREVAESAQHDAEDANKAKSEFLAVMSHELRTPLNAIGGYAELMQLGIHGPVTNEQLVALERIQRSQRHLLGLINGVLNYSRVEAGAVHYEVADVPLEETLATCEALIAPQLRAKKLELVNHLCPPGTIVRADREKLQQVILNLLSNSVKFTEPGGRVELTCSTLPNGMMSVRVRDTGRGIPPEQLERVFHPFVQVDAGLTRTQDGVGLGLAISRDLARGMGGDLTVESEQGRGSTFTLTVPVAEPAVVG